MWKLNPPTKDLIDWYLKTMIPGLKDRIQNSKNLPEKVKEILMPPANNESVLRCLLIDPPFQSISLSNKLQTDIEKAIALMIPFPHYTWDTIRVTLKNVFDYDTQLSKNQPRSFRIAHEQGRNTCTYCNRLYSFTVVRNVNEPTRFQIRTNNKNRIVRPQLDHWFDKSDYPLLSLNLYNLIPSCAICNSSVKHSAKFSLYTHIHPYLYHKNEPDFKFRLSLNKTGNFIVDIDDSKCTEPEKNMIRDLALREIYAYHGELEGKDIYLWRIKNSPSYLERTMKRIEIVLRRSPEDIYRMFFGVEYSSDNNLNRPFSKLKQDLLEDFGIKPI